MADEGFIKIHRKILKWEWYEDVNVVKLFLHCLILANHKPKSWKGIAIERGEFITSLGNLAKGSGLSVRQVRTALGKLKATNEVTSEATNNFTLIKVNEYNTYHEKGKKSDMPNDNQSANERQTNDKRAATTKNVKNVKNDKNGKNKEKDLFLDFVKLTKEELGKLVKKFGEKGAEERIWNLNDYGHRKKKKFNEYTDHYRTILNWARREENGKDNRRGKQEPIKKAESKSGFIPGRETIITIED